MVVYSVQDLNEIWVVERVIDLLDQARNVEARSLAREWDFSWDDPEDEGGTSP